MAADDGAVDTDTDPDDGDAGPDDIDVGIDVGLDVANVIGKWASEPPSNVIDPNARARPSRVAEAPNVIDDADKILPPKELPDPIFVPEPTIQNTFDADAPPLNLIDDRDPIVKLPLICMTHVTPDIL